MLIIGVAEVHSLGLSLHDRLQLRSEFELPTVRIAQVGGKLLHTIPQFLFARATIQQVFDQSIPLGKELRKVPSRGRAVHRLLVMQLTETNSAAAQIHAIQNSGYRKRRQPEDLSRRTCQRILNSE